MTLGEKIRAWGTGEFGSIKDFAEAMKMQPPSLQKYMNGERKPGTEVLRKLKALGCPIEWLLAEGNNEELNEAKAFIINSTISDKPMFMPDSIEPDKLKEYLEMLLETKQFDKLIIVTGLIVQIDELKKQLEELRQESLSKEEE
jgi:transcriptional regulator with XRE-family HTH domain